MNEYLSTFKDFEDKNFCEPGFTNPYITLYLTSQVKAKTGV